VDSTSSRPVFESWISVTSLSAEPLFSRVMRRTVSPPGLSSELTGESSVIDRVGSASVSFGCVPGILGPVHPDDTAMSAVKDASTTVLLSSAAHPNCCFARILEVGVVHGG
jgi:hypothetical protein